MMKRMRRWREQDAPACSVNAHRFIFQSLNLQSLEWIML